MMVPIFTSHPLIKLDVIQYSATAIQFTLMLHTKENVSIALMVNSQMHNTEIVRELNVKMTKLSTKSVHVKPVQKLKNPMKLEETVWIVRHAQVRYRLEVESVLIDVNYITYQYHKVKI